MDNQTVTLTVEQFRNFVKAVYTNGALDYDQNRGLINELFDKSVAKEKCETFIKIDNPDK